MKQFAMQFESDRIC